MSTPTPVPRLRRNLRALFVLAFTLSVLAAATGGLLLALGYPRPSASQPLWQFGQYVLILGSMNLAVYFALWWQVRALLKESGA